MNDQLINTIQITVKDNVASIRFPISIYINADIATSLSSHLTRYRIYQDKSFIVYLDNIKYITKEAMQVLSSNNKFKVIYVALVVKSNVGRMISGIFLAFNLPPFPINSFTDTDQAIKTVKMHDSQPSVQREYLEGYLAARANKRMDDCPYLSAAASGNLRKFDNWVRGWKDYQNGLRLDFENDEINIDIS